MLLLLWVWMSALWAQGSRKANSEVFYRNLKSDVRLKDEKKRPNPQKRWINKSSLQSRNVHGVLTETVLVEQKQLDDISLRRIKILFSGWSESLPSIRKTNFYLELFRLRYQDFKSKECIMKLYVNFSLILNLCKWSSVWDNCCNYINNLI